MPLTTSTLLRGDHISRGRGAAAYTPQVLAFLFVQIAMIAFAYWETVQGGGLVLLEKLFGVSGVSLEPTHAWLLFVAMAVYHVKVFRWSGFVNHSNTLGIFTLVLVTCYHTFAMFSIGMSAYYHGHGTNFRPTRSIQIVFLVLTVVVLSLEAMADQQLARFKQYKSASDKNSEQLKALVGENSSTYDERVCRVGMWGYCRHPNYFWNLFPFAFAAVVGGNWACALMWVGIQVFWAFTQSMPALESFMADKYGRDWEEYCGRVRSRLVPGTGI